MKIGETLRDAGLISIDALKNALKDQEKNPNRLGDILVEKGVITSEEMAPVLAKYFNLPFVNLKKIYKDIKPEIVDMVPDQMAKRFNTMPIDLDKGVLTVATFDPLNLFALDTIRKKTGLKISCVIASETDIHEAIEYCYNYLPRMKQSVESFIDLEIKDQQSFIEDYESSQFGADDQPVVQYVKSLIVQAVNNRASDVHLQPKQDSVELRMRIDGVLYSIEPPPKEMLPAISSRIKILSGLDIAEKRLPQDGRFKANLGKMEVDIRTSIFPTIYGESVVMRLLDTSAPLLGLNHLGLDQSDLELYKRIIYSSYGLILVTGPTGSGKTTTLYTTLNEIKSDEKNILTLEDPVEYRLPFIQQTQVNPQIGFDFAKGLRSVLRQDPDVIMVGEIRDKETAEIAIHAALTGHLVFATLHTNDSAGAAVRLINMGIEPFLITSSLLGVVAQRLMRSICPDCKETRELNESDMEKVSANSGITHLSRGKGCPKCINSGYKGREGIYELLIPNEEIRRLILANSSSENIRTAAQKAGMKTLRQLGLKKVKEGRTTLAELLRITQETEEH